MEIRVLARTEMASDINIDKVKRFGGLNAGICYSSKPFFVSLITEDIDKSIKRYDQTISNFHHSIGNHFEVTILIEGVSKMMAMLLNSFTFYNTSERSGRYTKMGDNELYNHWFEIFKSGIMEKYPEFGEKYAEKLAMENARYVLPIFQKTTTMSYTTSIMEFNYICNWFRKFMESHADYQTCDDIKFANAEDRKYFYENIFIEMQSFIDNIRDCGILMDNHVDNKNRKIDFFEDIELNSIPSTSVSICNRAYEIVDTLTFPAFADLLRHRTYNKSIVAMCNINERDPEYYVPEIIKDTPYESEWIETLSESEYIPQGKLITIREVGKIDYFVLKAKERLCSRVQLEVLRAVTRQIEAIACIVITTNNKYLCSYAQYKLSEIYDFSESRIKTKCEITGGCKEPCLFTPARCFSREV